MATKLAGSCLCGALRFEATGDPIFQGFCQCLDCRKATGSGHYAAIGMPEGAVKVTGPSRKYAKKADSGHLIERNFCPTCGSMVFDTGAGMPGVLIVNAALLDDPEFFKPQMVVFARSGLSWDLIDPQLPKFAAMPPRG
jgi:hypothetical protein